LLPRFWVGRPLTREHLGDTNLAALSYEESARDFSAFPKATQQSPREYSPEAIRDLIAKWDATGKCRMEN